MTKAEFFAILEKHLDGSATEAERRLLDDFYQHHLAESQKEWTFTDKERIRMEVLESLNQAIDEDMRQHRRARFGRSWRIAASVTILLAVGLGLYTRIAPEEVRYITTTAQRGEQQTVTLSDGSIVQLNAESSVTFPEKFTASESRRIEFSGEAFFDVVPDESKPFIIHSNDLITTVVGTSFNIRAYPEDETIAVTVATGKVKIEASRDRGEQTEGYVLLPGEQGLYDRLSARIAKTQVKMEKYLAWKEGIVMLEGASLKQATDILGRWYDVEFIFTNPDLRGCTIDGKFKNDELTNILENLRFLMGIEYSIEGKKVTISGESCH